MASSSSLFSFFLLCSFLFSIIYPSIAKSSTGISTSTSSSSSSSSFQPKALFLPVKKVFHSPTSNQYVTSIKQRTPLVPIKLTVEVGGEYSWVDCEQGYVSSTYKPARCGSSICSINKFTRCYDCFNSSQSIKPGCNKNTCFDRTFNSVGGVFMEGELSQDIISIQSTDGSNPGKVVSMPNFLFLCGKTNDVIQVGELARGVKGMVGLGRTKVGLPSQFATSFRFQRKFAICLSSSTKSNGAIFFGNVPYFFHSKIDVSKSLTYTPLVINPGRVGTVVERVSSEYFIGVKSIKINDKVVRGFNTSLLSFDKKGFGGTVISTTKPYTILEASIYNVFIDAFVKAVGEHVEKVAAVEPFEVCFKSTNIASTRVGPAVPTIELVLQNKVVWKIFGANSMVKVAKDVLCLGYLNGDKNPIGASIVIGAYQLEDNVLEFDIAKNRLGFSSSLLFKQTTCSNFNFTTN